MQDNLLLNVLKQG